MKKTSLFLLMAILVLALVKPAAAEITLTVDQLKKMKIDPTSFSLANMSQDGKTLLGVEKIRDAKRKARGEVWQVKIFRIEGAAAKVDAVLLPTTQLEQMAISPDGKSALALSDFGTRFIAIDLEKKSARTLWKNEAGKPGFRSQPEVIW